MKFIFILIGLAVMAFANDLDFAGVVLIVGAFLVGISLPTRKVGLAAFYDKMPTVWQNIPETLELAAAQGLLGDRITFDTVANFYQVIERFPEHFDMKVADGVVLMFEREYPNLKHPDQDFSPKTRAAYYYMCALGDLSLMPVVAKMISVCKKVSGEPKREKEEKFTIPSFA